jgi:uncharacterized protein
LTKIKINPFISFAAGLALLSFGVVLVVKANYGVTVVISAAYVLSQKFTVLSFGKINYIVQGVVFIIMIIVMNKINAKYFLSFLASVIFGYAIDLFTYLLLNFSVTSHYLRIMLFAFSIVIISLGLVFFLKSKLPIMPFDLFVREVSTKYNIKIEKFKTAFDIILLMIATTLSFIFFGRLNGIHIGTLVSALTIGSCIDFFIKVFDKYFYVDIKSKLQTL